MKAKSNNISRRSFLECMACFAAGQAFAAHPGMFSGADPKLVLVRGLAHDLISIGKSEKE